MAGLSCHGISGAERLSNGDFGSGLIGWEVSGIVLEETGQARLAEAATGRTLLYQAVALGGGGYTLSFDFRGLLAGTEPIGFSLDTFFASLYLSEPGEEFTPLTGTGFSHAYGLLDLDVDGARAVAGAVEALGGGFNRYAFDFLAVGPVVATVVFELANLNGNFGDSSVLVDNVAIVPEPAQVGVVLAGMVAGVLLVRRRRKGI